MIYTITGSGLKPLRTSKINLVVGAEMFIGASSCPDHAVVTKVTDRIVNYRTYPYKKDTVCDKRIFLDMAEQGTRTQIKSYQNYIQSSYADSETVEYFKEQISKLERTLEGDNGETANPEDLQPVMILIKPVTSFEDAWAELESHRRWSTLVSCQWNDGTLEVTGCRKDIKTVKDEVPDGFEYVGFKED